jgi:tetratricopeptide (TPR) repeat protein
LWRDVRSATTARRSGSSALCGDFEAVRQGHATLPQRIADAPDARILEIELDFNRGRTARTLEKIDLQPQQAEAMDNPVVRARLLILNSKLSARSGKTPTETLALAQSALDLLDAADPSASPAVRGSALERRGLSLFQLDRLNDALRDLGLAVPLLEQSGSPRNAMGARSNMARVWMRMGRLQEALATLGNIAHGRWLLAQGQPRDAEDELRAARVEARAMNHFHRMSLATEPLVVILLQRNNTAGAQTAVDALQAVDPPRVGRDYRFNALRLRVALAMGDAVRIEDARRKVLAVAGERRWSDELMRSVMHGRERR